jgi:hypothetical protein
MNEQELKQFVLVTKSESGDDYIYFIKSETKPTDEEINEFLFEHGNDIEESEGSLELFEEVVFIKEIKDFTTLK